MAESASGQDGSLLGISRVGPARKSSLLSHIINPLLSKLGQSKWLDIGPVFFPFLLPRLRLIL